MFARRPLLAVLTTTLLLAACDKPKVATYRVPKEKAAESPNALPAGHPPIAASNPTGNATDMAATPVTTASGAGLTWTAPAHWKPKPASAMRKGSYAIAGDGGVDADLSITAFPGNVGGDLANLNRWRGQLQLPPITESEFASATGHLDANGLHITTVDIIGSGANPQRILGAMIPHGDATWFVKLLGPDALLAKEKAAFNAFLATIKPTTGSAP